MDVTQWLSVRSTPACFLIYFLITRRLTRSGVVNILWLIESKKENQEQSYCDGSLLPALAAREAEPQGFKSVEKAVNSGLLR